MFLTLDGEVIETTSDHPFYTQENGWTEVDDLKVGDHIRRADGSYGIVEAVSTTILNQPMFNLTVDTAHTFFVGNGAWLVHNNECTHIPLDPNRGDTNFNTQDEALNAVLEQHNVDPSNTEIERIPQYGKSGDNSIGPHGEPWEIVKAIDRDGNVVEITHHKNGHHWVEENEFSRPHYHGPHVPGQKGTSHLFYGEHPLFGR